MKNVEFETPCGFRVTLVVDEEGLLTIKSSFNGELISFVNSNYTLSEEGAIILSDQIKRIYGAAG